jgi:primosomal protein N' (replication factor Y)
VATLPTVRVVDMKTACDKAGGFTHFSEELLEGLKKRLKNGEQSLLFLNRRGTHRMQTCNACRHTIKCQHCDLALTYHRSDNLLQCHLCGFQQKPPRQCPACQNPESLQFKGFGTEHVERSLHAIFPEIRTLRMDKDTTKGKTSHEDLFKQFRAHKADVLIGTQMIAKGFHFPSVTLVGILNSDATLSIPDFRSAEQVFQLVTQVAGRSGRAELPGEVIIQTFMPDHATLKMAARQDYNDFYKAEIEERKMFGYPPFIRMIKLLFTAPELETAERLAQETYAHLTKVLPPPHVVLPPTPSGYTKIKDQFRFQFIIKTPKILSVTAVLKELKVPGMKIDVDPLSTFL